MAHRRGSRKLALDVLYEQELGARPFSEILERYSSNPGYEFAHALVQGVAEHKVELDQLIVSHARDWSIERMPVIDRNLLRLGLFEMMFLAGDVPPAVAINEAVEMAKIYSTDNSSRFVNGLLGAVLAERTASGA